MIYLRHIMAKKKSNYPNENDNLLITKEELEEFKALALKEYGIKLTDEQAFEQGRALLNLFDQMLNCRLQKSYKSPSKI